VGLPRGDRDTALVLSRYVDGPGDSATFASRICLELRALGLDPVINALTDLEIPARPWLIFGTLKDCLRQASMACACAYVAMANTWPTRCCSAEPCWGLSVAVASPVAFQSPDSAVLEAGQGLLRGVAAWS